MSIEKHLISVIIPTKNRLKELRRAVISVLKQTHQDFEILVIDDHSDDDIESSLLEFKDERIKYFKSEKLPSNANVCRNIGLKNAKGQYVAMLDSDDEWLPDHLENRLLFIQENNCDGVFGSYQTFDGESTKTFISRPFKAGESMVDYLLTDGHAVTPSHFYNATTAKQIGWNEDLKRHQDYDFSIRYGAKFKFNPCDEVSVIVHWRKGEKRVEDFDSQRLFVQLHQEDMSRKVYNLYHEKMYQSIYTRSDVSKEIKNHYNRNRFKFFHALSLNEFLGSQVDNPGKMKRVYLRVKYAFKVLFSK